LGEVARRVDGRGFAQLLREEIAEPLGLSTLFVGLPEEVTLPVAWLEEPEFVMPPDDGSSQVVPLSLLPLSAWMNLPAGRRACVPAGSGIMNAPAVARHYAALLPGGVDGVALLPPERVERATETRPFPLNVEGTPTTWGLGYAVGMPEAAPADSPALFGHAGHGGSVGLVDRDHRLAVGLTRNRLQKETPLAEILELLRSPEVARGESSSSVDWAPRDFRNIEGSNCSYPSYLYGHQELLRKNRNLADVGRQFPAIGAAINHSPLLGLAVFSHGQR